MTGRVVLTEEAAAALLERAAASAAEARAELELAIRDARAAGLSLRAISGLAGLSPEWVRRIAAGTARASS